MCHGRIAFVAPLELSDLVCAPLVAIAESESLKDVKNKNKKTNVDQIHDMAGT